MFIIVIITICKTYKKKMLKEQSELNNVVLLFFVLFVSLSCFPYLDTNIVKYSDFFFLFFSFLFFFLLLFLQLAASFFLSISGYKYSGGWGVGMWGGGCFVCRVTWAERVRGGGQGALVDLNR